MTEVKPRFFINVIDEKVKIAAGIASAMLHQESYLMGLIKDKNDFKYDSGTGEQIYDKFKSTSFMLPVFSYKPLNRWTSAIGYYQSGRMFINGYKLPSMTVQEIAANLCHEYCHAIGYHHGNNFKTEDKMLYSVPYYVSEHVQKVSL